jgi:transposase
VWDKIHGMQSLEDYLTTHGVDLKGQRLTLANDVSDDGKTIVGYGDDALGQPEAWIATLDLPAVPEPTVITILLAALTFPLARCVTQGVSAFGKVAARSPSHIYAVLARSCVVISAPCSKTWISRASVSTVRDKPRGRRPDIFKDHWQEMAQCLEQRPDQTALELLIEFQARYPGQYSLPQLSTLQKRVRMWWRQSHSTPHRRGDQ